MADAPTGGTAAPAATRRRPVLAQAFDPRRNALDVVRLGLAAVVALTHGQVLGFGDQPVLGSAFLGDVAVDAFFVLSGFLVVRSYLRLRSVRRYLWHRALRIVPAFWVCLLLTAAVVAPLVAVLRGLPVAGVFTGERSALTYLSANAALHVGQFDIAGLRRPGGAEVVVNGSLWTVFFEALCYGAVLALGLVGALRRRRWVLPAALAALWLAALVTAAGVDLELPVVRRLVLMFLLGVAAHQYAHRVVVDGRWALVALALVVAGLHLTPDYRVVGGAALAYLLVYAAVRLPWRRPLEWDLSYGLYVYHWPVQLVMASAGLAVVGVLPFLAIGLLLSLLVACGSWLLVERPALGLRGARRVEFPLPPRVRALAARVHA